MDGNVPRVDQTPVGAVLPLDLNRRPPAPQGLLRRLGQGFHVHLGVSRRQDEHVGQRPRAAQVQDNDILRLLVRQSQTDVLVIAELSQ